MPQVGGGEGECRPGADQSDIWARRLRRRIPAEGGGARRRQRQLRFRRRIAAAGEHRRRPAALADLATELCAAGVVLSCILLSRIALSGFRPAAAVLWRLERAGLADRAGHSSGRGRDRTAAERGAFAGGAAIRLVGWTGGGLSPGRPLLHWP